VEIQDFIDSLASLGSAQEVAAALEEALPALAGSMTEATKGARNGTNRAIQARQDANKGLSSGDLFLGDRMFWLKPLGSWANQDDRKGVSGFDTRTYGVVAGMDGEISDKSRIGFAFAFNHTNVDGSSNLSQSGASIRSYQGIFYGSYNLDDTTELTYQADIGLNKNKTHHAIGAVVASGDYNSWVGHVGTGLSRTFSYSQSTSFTPGISLDYTYIRDQAYTETGAGGLSQAVDDNNTDELILMVDGRVDHAISQGTTITANLGVGYDVLSERTSVTSSFTGGGAAFTTQGLDPSPVMIRGGAGLVMTNSNAMEVTARYDFEVREDFDSHTASLKLRMPF
jgi:outer membrane autotransporter protein